MLLTTASGRNVWLSGRLLAAIFKILMRDKMHDKEMNVLRKEIELFIQYSVTEDMLSRALALVAQYERDRVALRLLHEFYRSLPEAREEPVIKLVQIDSHQGVLLLGVISLNYQYLYLVTENEVISLGEKGGEIENDVLSFFGYAGQDELDKACVNLQELEEYHSKSHLMKTKCPVCSVFEGELHQLGCPVEVCPWCDGQLNRCNCRFDQLGVDKIGNEEEVHKFEQLLAVKGRIRFAKEQAPAYPSAGDESIEDEE